MLTFPITFLLGDIINEYFGAKATKNTVYLGLVMSMLVFFFMNIAQAMPYLDKSFNGMMTCLCFVYKLFMMIFFSFIFPMQFQNSPSTKFSGQRNLCISHL